MESESVLPEEEPTKWLKDAQGKMFVLANVKNKSSVKLSFLEEIHSKNPDWGEATETLVNYIKSQLVIYTTKDDEKSEVWVYDDGVYVPAGKSKIKEILRDLLGEAYSVYILNQVVAKVEADTFIEPQKFFSQNYIDEVPVLNGILNIREKQLYNFDSKKIFFNKLNVEYNPLAECPQIDKFLSEVLSKEEDRKVFYELGGFCLLKEYRFEKAFMFVGNGRNGKDKSLELIKRLLGIDNCCSVPLCSLLPESFIISEFFGKMVNIAGEISHNDLKETQEFKGLTGRSLRTAKRKFLKPISFVNYAKFIFACNDLPMVYDNSKGFWDRWVLLEFPYTFVTQEELDIAENKTMLKLRDENIINKITTPEELSGLLNKFLEGLDRLTERKNFSCTRGSEEIKQLWIRKSNSVMAFGLEMIEDSYDSWISKKEFRKKYSIFCKQHRIVQKSDLVIKRTLEELFGCTEGTKNTAENFDRVWEGIKWKAEKLKEIDFPELEMLNYEVIK